MSKEAEYCRSIGMRIREVRLRREMTQADAANKAGVSLPHMNRIEQGKANMQIETFAKIAAALDVSADYLLNLPAQNINHDAEIQLMLDGRSPTEVETILKLLRDVIDVIDRGGASEQPER